MKRQKPTQNNTSTTINSYEAVIIWNALEMYLRNKEVIMNGSATPEFQSKAIGSMLASGVTLQLRMKAIVEANRKPPREDNEVW